MADGEGWTVRQAVRTPHFRLLFAVYMFTGLGSLSYGELAGMMPEAGGMYVYLREAFSPLLGFLYGWTLLTVIQTGTIAAVGIAFARFSGILFPSIREDKYLIAPVHLVPGYAISLSTAQLLAIVIIVQVVLSATRFGVYTQAVGSNPVGAQEAGVRANRIKIVNFALVSTLAGLGGIVDGLRVGSFDPTNGGSNTMFLAVASAVIPACSTRASAPRQAWIWWQTGQRKARGSTTAERSKSWVR